MALLTRLSRLMKADVHAMLDRIEEPDLVLRQAVRDMEEEHLVEARSIERLKEDLENLGSRLTQTQSTLADIEPQLDDCFAADREDLVRDLIQRRLELQRMTSVSDARRESLQTDLARRESQQRENHIHLQSMRQKLEILADSDDHRSTDSEMQRFGVSRADVDIAFIQEKQRRSRA